MKHNLVKKKGSLIFKGGKTAEYVLTKQKLKPQQYKLLDKSLEPSNQELYQENQEKKNNKTQAELSFELVQEKRMKERINEKLKQGTHKKRIENFNKKLSSLSDHFDVPKVGPV